MAVFRRRGRPGWYYDFFVNGKRRTLKGGDTKKEAELAAARAKLETKSARSPSQTQGARGVLNLGELCEEFLARPVAKTTRDNERPKFKSVILPFFGARVPPADLEKRDFLRYANYRLESGISPGTVHLDLSILRSLFAWAMEFAPEYRVKENPVPTAAKVPAVRRADPRKDFLSVSQMTKLLGVAKARKEPYIYPLIATLVFSGGRFDETRRLAISDLNIESRNLWFAKRKSGKARYVPMSTGLHQILEQWLRDRPVGEARLFTNMAGRLPSHSRMGGVWSELLTAAGVPHMQLHCTRHTAISHWVMAGVPLRVAQEWAGHSSIKITMQYSHLAPEVGATSMQRVDQWRALGHTSPLENAEEQAMLTSVNHVCSGGEGT